VLEERARIARELHDSVSQTLYAIMLGATRACNLMGGSDANDVQRILEGVLQLASAGQSELRALMTELRTDGLTSAGLVAALESLVVDVRTRDGLDIRLSPGEDAALTAKAQQAVLMIVREALHNVVKHSAACHVDIELERDGEQLVLLITDDGRGFATATRRPGHFGMQSMKERATAVGGTLAVRSAVGLGTQVRVSVPAHWDNDG
jgi:signal transduction histidine kinase